MREENEEGNVWKVDSSEINTTYQREKDLLACACVPAFLKWKLSKTALVEESIIENETARRKKLLTVLNNVR